MSGRYQGPTVGLPFFPEPPPPAPSPSPREQRRAADALAMQMVMDIPLPPTASALQVACVKRARVWRERDGYPVVDLVFPEPVTGTIALLALSRFIPRGSLVIQRRPVVRS